MKTRFAIISTLVALSACSDPSTSDIRRDAGTDSGEPTSDAAADAAVGPADASRDADPAADAAQDHDAADVEDVGAAPDVTTDDAGWDMADAAEVDMGAPSNDPFDPASCSGATWDTSGASARLAGMPAELLDSATVMQRSRPCDDMGCGAWSAPTPAVLSFLTWSGGVSTRYKQLQIDTTLVLWDDGGTPKLSVRHVTDLNQYPDEHQRGLTFGFPAETIAYPIMRAWNVVPDNQYDYRDLENYIGRDAQLLVSPTCARFVAVLPGGGEPPNTEYAALYRF